MITSKEHEQFKAWMKSVYDAYSVLCIKGEDHYHPNDQDFSLALGISPASYNRWMHDVNPPDNFNLLLLVVNSGSTRPLEIYGKKGLLGNPRIAEMLADYRAQNTKTQDALIAAAKQVEEQLSPVMA
jgi:hypothetical protein